MAYELLRGLGGSEICMKDRGEGAGARKVISVRWLVRDGFSRGFILEEGRLPISKLTMAHGSSIHGRHAASQSLVFCAR